MLKKVKIGALKYDVVVKKEPILVDNQGCYGSIDYEGLTVYIGMDFPKMLQEETLIHEILHGIIKERNLDLDDEENLVIEISRGIHQVIKDNEEFLEFFKEDN